MLGKFGFRILWDYDELCAKAKVYEIVAIDVTADVPPFECCDETTENVSEAEAYMEISVKWDGCSHVYTPQYWHWCGYEYYRKHIDLVEYLYKRPFALMGRELP